jgi:biopolymer transport protein TolQ
VAPGVSEALITTAAGLVVAIPAVIAYNQFTASLREFGSRMDDFSRELLNSLEEISLQSKPDPMEREAASGLHR